jgi:hypothetical protein
MIAKGFKTKRGKPYVSYAKAGGRGTGRYISALHAYTLKLYGQAKADAVAEAFVNANGENAWEV